MFTKLKSEGKVSKNPLKESFSKKGNFKMVLLALFGATMGQGVIWYTGQFYAQSFIENTCKVDFNDSRYILLWGIAFATPFFVVFGSWSDKVGRKWIMLTGMLLGIIFYRPIYQVFIDKTDVSTVEASRIKSVEAPIVTKIAIHDGVDSLINTASRINLVDGSSFVKLDVDTVYADVNKEIGHAPTLYKDKKIKYTCILDFYWFSIFPNFIGNHGLWPNSSFLGRIISYKN